MRTKIFSYFVVLAMIFAFCAGAGFANSSGETALTQGEMENLHGYKTTLEANVIRNNKRIAGAEVHLNSGSGEHLMKKTDSNGRAIWVWGNGGRTAAYIAQAFDRAASKTSHIYGVGVLFFCKTVVNITAWH